MGDILSFNLLTPGQLANFDAFSNSIAEGAWGDQTGNALLQIGSAFVEAGVTDDSFFKQLQAYGEAVGSKDFAEQQRLLQQIANGIPQGYYEQALPHLTVKLGLHRFAKKKPQLAPLSSHVQLAPRARIDTNGAAVVNGAVWMMSSAPTWIEPLQKDLASKIESLLESRKGHLGSIPAEVFKELVSVYLQYWFAHFKGVAPATLTFLSEALHAAIDRVWKGDAASEGIFYREATFLVYGLATWSSSAALAAPGSVGATYLSHNELVKKMGEHHAILEMLYGDLVAKEKVNTANAMMELVYKYVRLLHQRVGSKLDEKYLKKEGLEAGLVHLLLVRAENREPYTNEALEALRYFFATITGRASPSLQNLKDLSTPKVAVAETTVPSKISYLPVEKGWRLAELIDHLPFRLGDAETKEAFKTRVGITYEAVRQWGKLKDLSIEKTPLDENVAVEPEEHQKMFAVYLELDRMCQRHGVRLDFLDYLATIFPTINEMKKGGEEIVVRIPNIVREIDFSHLNYSTFAVMLKRSGFHGLLGADVERPHWVTLAKIAQYISGRAGGEETHQKEIYNFLVMLRLIDVLPLAVEIRDVSGIVRSKKDPEIVSRYRLQVYPEDPDFKYAPNGEEDAELITAKRWPISDVKSGKFDTMLESLEGRVAALSEFLGLNYPLVTSHGEPTTIAVLKEKLHAIRQQHALYRGDLNDLSYDSPLRQEKAKDYLKNLRKFYRGVEELFREWHLCVHARGVLRAGPLDIDYVIIPSVRGVTKAARMENNSVAVVADDIPILKTGREAVFHLRIVIAKLLQEGILSEEDLQNAEKIFKEVSPYLAETPAVVMQAVKDNMLLAEELSQKKLPALEAELVRVLVNKPAPLGSTRDPYYLHSGWENDLRRFYKEMGEKEFAEGDVEIAHDYFISVRYPHSTYNEKKLQELAGPEATLATFHRLKSFFSTIGVATSNAVATNGVVANGEVQMGKLSEIALRTYIDTFPAARALNVPVPMAETVLREVVDRLLVQHPEARGHRTVLISNLRKAVAEHNQAGDRASFTKLEATYPPLPLGGMFVERFGPYAANVSLRHAYFNLLPQLRDGKKPAREDCIRALEHVSSESNADTLFQLMAFIDHQWSAMERFKNRVEDPSIGAGNYFDRKYRQNESLIDKKALARLALFYLNNRILGSLPVALDDAIIEEVSKHFAPLQEVRDLAVSSYRILLSEYLHALVGNLKDGHGLIFMALDAVVEKSQATTRKIFLEEVAREYDSHTTPELLAEGARDYEVLAPLFGEKVEKTYEEAVDEGYKTVAERVAAQKENKKGEFEKQAGEIKLKWDALCREVESALVLPLPSLPEFEPVIAATWSASAIARDDYRKILGRTAKAFDKILPELEAASSRIENAARKRSDLTTVSEALRKILLLLERPADFIAQAVQILDAPLQQRQEELKTVNAQLTERRKRVLADLAAVTASHRADTQAQQLLVTTSKVLEIAKGTNTFEVEVIESKEKLCDDYEKIVAETEQIKPVTLAQAEALNKRCHALIIAFNKIATEHTARGKKLEAELPESHLPSLGTIERQLRELADHSVAHHAAVNEMLGEVMRVREETARLTEKHKALSVTVKPRVNAAQERFQRWLKDNIIPMPFNLAPTMADRPAGPYFTKAGQMISLVAAAVSPAEKTERVSIDIGNEKLLITSQGTFVVESRVADAIEEWLQGSSRKILRVLVLGKVIDLMPGSIVILKEAKEAPMWKEALAEDPPKTSYGRFLKNEALICSHGNDLLWHLYLTIIVNTDPQASSLKSELEGLMMAYNPSQGFEGLVLLIQDWLELNYEKIMAVPSWRRSLEKFFSVGKPYMALRTISADETAQLLPKGKVYRDTLKEMGWPLGDLSNERWVALAKIQITLFPKNARVREFFVHGGLAGLRSLFGQIFDHLISISPGLYQEIIVKAAAYMDLALVKKPEADLDDLLAESMILYLQKADREVCYHDIFHHYHPWDWSPEYLEAGRTLYEGMLEAPDAYGLRVVGWRGYNQKTYLVSKEQREAILAGDKNIIALPKEIRPDQLRWIAPYNQTNPEIWKVVKTFYEDPSMTVCASIYEEAQAMAARKINPEPMLLQIIDSLLEPSIITDKALLRKAMVTAYCGIVLGQDNAPVRNLKKANVLLQTEPFLLFPMPVANAPVAAWHAFAKERKTWLVQHHFLGYDRQLDRSLQGAYNTLVRAGVSFGDKESALLEWLGFLEESLRLWDIDYYAKNDIASARNFIEHYKMVGDLLISLYRAQEGEESEKAFALRDRLWGQLTLLKIRLPNLSEQVINQLSLHHSSMAKMLGTKKAVSISIYSPINFNVTSVDLDAEFKTRPYGAKLKKEMEAIRDKLWKAQIKLKGHLLGKIELSKLNLKAVNNTYFDEIYAYYFALRRANPQTDYASLVRVAVAERYGNQDADYELMRANILASFWMLTRAMLDSDWITEDPMLLRDFPELHIGKLRYTEIPPETSPLP